MSKRLVRMKLTNEQYALLDATCTMYNQQFGISLDVAKFSEILLIGVIHHASGQGSDIIEPTNPGVLTPNSGEALQQREETSDDSSKE